MDSGPTAATGQRFRVLAVTQALWGERIAAHVTATAPPDWQVSTWHAPKVLPAVIDDPDGFLPDHLPTADLLLALGEVAGLAQLIPELARRSGARAVLAPIDRNESLPAGLVRQVESWLQAIGVPVLFPKPFCSLTESTVNHGRTLRSYDEPFIRRFASVYGRPRLEVEVAGDRLASIRVLRDSACGCARHVAEQLPGTLIDEAVEAAGMLHHHFPCLASMNQDADYSDTLMHVSGNLMREAVREGLGANLKPPAYLRPHGRVEPTDEQRPSWSS
jgi:hypothetical protein